MQGHKLTHSLALACLLALAPGWPATASADDAPPRIRFATWQNGATAAISLSFDDWTPDHWSRGMELWRKHGFRVTLGITMAKLEKHPEMVEHLQNAFDAGHELANHTVRHENFASLTQGQIRYDLGQCNDFILAKVEGIRYINTVIYPEEYYDEATLKTLKEMGYLFARSGPQGINEVVMLNDPLKPPLLHLFSWANQNNLTMQQWNNAVDWAISRGGWLIEQCHGIGSIGEPNVGWSPRPLAEYEAHFEYLKSQGDKLWIAPIGDVGRYVLERDNSRIEVLAYDGNQLSLAIRNDLDSDRFDVPLTVELLRPPLWIRVAAEQNGQSLPCTYTTEGWVRFNALPGGGSIMISKASTAQAEGRL